MGDIIPHENLVVNVFLSCICRAGLEDEAGQREEDWDDDEMGDDASSSSI
ncbi:hypothetical protein COCCADRAFT_100146 [Bipolaris zeicola 26-R-13]|uniref:Uncharacterized protein n=1 Tax=Cochliobolus carbonum (strain 26-R-13) TaxID=930089 RepID=W6Y1U4_COCC2|nr:uncharacterized protein COCCADRAFT_100146 [Bipolaris zeicola 26-R-13]EUC31873.1 hypothetical protein COCCADRAFT_100146 [Bipolaris zeicola 26-R-13]